MSKINIPLDQVRELRYDINTMADLEERFGGQPIPELLKEGRVGMTLIRSIIYFGLKSGGMKFTGRSVEENEQKVGSLIQQHWMAEGKDLKDLMDKAVEAFKAAGLFGKEEGEEGENPSKGTDGAQ